MLFVLAGPSYVGKKTALFHFMTLYSFQGITPYTTKKFNIQRREIEGIHYHYVTETDFQDVNSAYIYDCPFNCDDNKDDIIYAYRKKDIENAIESYSNFIIHASVGNAKKIYNEYNSTNIDSKDRKLYIFFLNYLTPFSLSFFKERYQDIKGVKIKESEEDLEVIFTSTESEMRGELHDFKRRFFHAKKEIDFYKNNKEIFDDKIKSDKIYEISAELERLILPRLNVMPTAPDRIPGPLSDRDIIYLSKYRKNHNLKVCRENKELTSEEIEELLCGSGLHITLSTSIRKISSQRYNNSFDMAENENEIESVLKKLYPEESIASGYELKPNETILCSSEECVFVPPDVYALVASKFSYSQLGLTIELGTSVIQPGHNGTIHFQIKNNSSLYIRIYPHIQVAYLLFFRTVQPTSKPYNLSKNYYAYDNCPEPPISHFWKNIHTNNSQKDKKNFLKSMFQKEPIGCISFITNIIGGVIFSICNFLYNLDGLVIKNFFCALQFQYQVILVFLSYYLFSKNMQVVWEICIYSYYKLHRSKL